MVIKSPKIIEDFYVDEKKLIKKLKEKQENQKNSNLKSHSGKIVRDCLKKFLNKNYRTHELLNEDVPVEKVKLFKTILFCLKITKIHFSFN